MNWSPFSRLSLVCIASMVLSCGEVGGDVAGVPEFPSELAGACTTILGPGKDDQTTVQTALIETAENATLCFGAGTFTFTSELSLDVDGVSIIGAGASKTLFDFRNQTVGSNGLLITSDNTSVLSSVSRSFLAAFTKGMLSPNTARSKTSPASPVMTPSSPTDPARPKRARISSHRRI